jgi:hypothetical protein
MTAFDPRFVACHELGHVLVGRARGYRVRSVCIWSAGGLAGSTEHHWPDLSDPDVAIDNIAVAEAGEIATRIVPWWTVGLPAAGPRSMTPAVALGRLSAADAEFLTLSRAEDGPPSATDAQRAERVARTAAGDVWEGVLRAGRARAWPHVLATAGLNLALIPHLLALPVMSGDDVEEAIAAIARKGAQKMPKTPNKRMKARKMVFVARESASIEVGDQDALMRAGRTCVPAESPLLRVAPSLFQPVPKLGACLVPPRYSPRYAEPRDASGAQISEPIPPARRLRSRSYLVHKGVQIAHVGQLFDRDSAIAQAIIQEYPGTLSPAEEDARC